MSMGVMQTRPTRLADQMVELAAPGAIDEGLDLAAGEQQVCRGVLAVAKADHLAVGGGATEVVVLHDGPRQDRAIVVVARPRWGWPGR
jgi:hypothetical protein